MDLAGTLNFQEILLRVSFTRPVRLNCFSCVTGSSAFPSKSRVPRHADTFAQLAARARYGGSKVSMTGCICINEHGAARYREGRTAIVFVSTGLW